MIKAYVVSKWAVAQRASIKTCVLFSFGCVKYALLKPVRYSVYLTVLNYEFGLEWGRQARGLKK
jgi:hypothetical protein